MHNPEKKDNTTSAIAEGAILGPSASMFMERRRSNSARFSATTLLVEHWDVIQDEATEEQSKSKAPMFGERFPTY